MALMGIDFESGSIMLHVHGSEQLESIVDRLLEHIDDNGKVWLGLGLGLGSGSTLYCSYHHPIIILDS